MSSRAAAAVYPHLSAKEPVLQNPPQPNGSSWRPTWAQSNDPLWMRPREKPPDFWWVPYHRKVKR